jgi:hypothetical protein
MQIIRPPQDLSEREDLGAFFQLWQFFWDWRGAKEVRLDFSECRRIEPWAVVAFAAWARHIAITHDVRFDVYAEGSTQGARLLRQANLADLIHSPSDKGEVRKCSMGAFLDCTSERDIAPFLERIDEKLPKLDDDTRSALQYIVVEMVRNVAQHAAWPAHASRIARMNTRKLT